MVEATRWFSDLSPKFNKTRFKKLTETMSFPDYLDKVRQRPQLALSAYQRLYNMIVGAGVTTSERYRRTVTRYKFFDDDQIPICGLDNTLESLVKHIKGAADWYGTERRILLLHGPVGSSKSTICRRLKRGMEDYSHTDEGAIYTYEWVDIQDHDIKSTSPCPMNDDPLKLIPLEMREEVLTALNARFEEITPENQRHMVHPIRLVGELNPHCKYFMDQLLRKYDGDWGKIVSKHIKVKRILLSEADRIGIGTFQPKDPKNQDATELTGDINYMKLGHYGVDSDPRAFSFDGEFEISNRGMLEMIEILKLEKEFLYDLLGVCQERQFKPKKFPQIDVDLVLIGHTNSPEFEKLKADQTMEALRDRTVRVDVPYLLEWKNEQRVLNHDYGKHKVRQHVAPHTIETAALWSVLTRLTPDKDNKISLVEKAKLYDGRSLPGWTEDSVKEMKDKYPNEGLGMGVSARFVQNAISNALVSNHVYINPFMVLNEIQEKLKNLMINDENHRGYYASCVELAKKELDEILKNEVQKALVADNNAIERLFTNYIDNVVAHVEHTKVRNPYTGQEVEPDERLMRSIEEKADIPEPMADDFRRQIAQFIGTMTIKKKEVRWDSNPKLSKALEKKLFEDTKDSIKLSALSNAAGVVDKDLQDKIDAIKARMIKNFGYNEESATDVLNYTSALFARGDLVDD
jgi:serine protein kinase